MTERGSEHESDFFKLFRTVYAEGNRAWNEHDFKRAYGGLPDDFVYELGPTWPQARPLRGPDQIVAFFEEFREMFPDARSGPITYIEVDERTMITGFEVTGTGRRSGARTQGEVWQVWEIGEDLVPVRVVEFPDRRTALEAAGIEEQATRERR